MSLYPVMVDGDVITLDDQHLSMGRDMFATLKHANGSLKLSIRPEFVQLAVPGEIGTVVANAHQVQQLGTHQLLTATLGEVGGLSTRAKLPNEVNVTESHVWLRLDAL